MLANQDLTKVELKRPAAYWALLSLLVFQGISATPSGLLLIVDPTGGSALDRAT